MIREEKIHQVYSVIQTGGEYGMQSMNQAMVDLFKKKLVTRAEIMARSTEPKDLERLMKHAGLGGGPAF
jgi:twitching motility protein PilT